MINEMKFMTLLWIYAETTETTPWKRLIWESVHQNISLIIKIKMLMGDTICE